MNICQLTIKDTTKDQSHDSLQLRNCLRCRLTSARTRAHLQICSYGETSPCKLRLGPWEISLPSQLWNHGGCRKCHECRQKICILYPMFTCEYSMSCVPRACVWAQRSQHRACHSVWRKRSEVEAARYPPSYTVPRTWDESWATRGNDVVVVVVQFLFLPLSFFSVSFCPASASAFCCSCCSHELATVLKALGTMLSQCHGANNVLWTAWSCLGV